MKFQAKCNSFFITMAAESELQIRRNNGDNSEIIFSCFSTKTFFLFLNENI